NTQIINSEGLILGPGLVDLYSHSGEPGFEERESLNSLLNAAAAGGFTRLAILPNTIPAIDHPATVTLLKERSRKVSVNSGFSVPNLYFWG
ncbi:MAG: dihydroorotase, partial [Planktothrix sp.]